MDGGRNNPSHRGHIGRLNRVAGQVEAVRRMIDGGEYCVDIMTQIRAARSALKSIELAILETHMRSCLDQAQAGGAQRRQGRIGEILALLRKYE